MTAGLKNGDGSPFNRGGLYRQKETGAEMYLENTSPELGSPMIDAFVKGGWVFVSESAPVTPEVKAEVSGDAYTESTTKNGVVQYRLNGKLISKEQFDNK